jgi:hypothetical protein
MVQINFPLSCEHILSKIRFPASQIMNTVLVTIDSEFKVRIDLYHYGFYVTLLLG